MTQPPGPGPAYPQYPAAPHGGSSADAPWSPPRVVQPLGALTTWVLVASVLLTVGAFVGAAAAFPSADRLARSEPDEVVFTVYDWTSLARFGLAVIALVVTSIWLYRARGNVTSLRPEAPQTLSPAWVVLGWIVPIVSLWFPFQVVRDVRRERWDAGTPRGFGLWWSLFLTASIVDNVGPVVTSEPELAPGLPWAATAAAVLWLVALVAWVRVVRSIDRDQQQLLATRAGVSAS